MHLFRLDWTPGRDAWDIEIPSPRAEAYRDTRGTGPGGWKALLAEARAKATTPKGKRDLALVRLMHDLGAGTVTIVGEGKSEKTNVTLNSPTAAALAS